MGYRGQCKVDMYLPYMVIVRVICLVQILNAYVIDVSYDYVADTRRWTTDKFSSPHIIITIVGHILKS